MDQIPALERAVLRHQEHDDKRRLRILGEVFCGRQPELDPVSLGARRPLHLHMTGRPLSSLIKALVIHSLERKLDHKIPAAAVTGTGIARELRQAAEPNELRFGDSA